MGPADAGRTKFNRGCADGGIGNGGGNDRRSLRLLLSDSDWNRLRRHLSLSPREMELVQHIFDGKKMFAIAGDMGLAIGTVKTYTQRIHQKLHVSDQRELVLSVMRAHLERASS
jgi:DNA-binding NarL/FixJ family response regulator